MSVFPCSNHGGDGTRYKIYVESFRGADHLRRILTEAQASVGAALAAPT